MSTFSQVHADYLDPDIHDHSVSSKSIRQDPFVVMSKAKLYAMQHYNKGMDTFVECYTDTQWLSWFKEFNPLTWREVKSAMISVASVNQEREADVKNSSF